MSIDSDDYLVFRRAVKELRRAGALRQGGFQESSKSTTGRRKARQIQGQFQATPRGFGFVTLPEEPGREDIYIPEEATGGAMHGDVVLVELTSRRQNQRQRSTGRIVEVIERRLRRLVGTLERVEGAWFLEPDGKQLTHPVLVDHPFPDELQPGRKAVAEIVEYPQGPGMLATAVVERFLGPAGELAVETESIIVARGLANDFSPEAQAEAAKIVQDFGNDNPSQASLRTDRQDLTVVTIDPVAARDFDDAISVETDAQGHDVLGVHIADVAHFVKPGSQLDVEARERGTSVYFPRHVLPMLPPGLSQGVCALRPDVPRYAVSVFMTYDAQGRVLKRRVESTVIRSCQRLTYEEAQALCDGDGENWKPAVVQLVQAMKALAEGIERRRRKEGMLHLDLPEVELTLGPEGRVVGAEPQRNDYSHRVIEMFMVEANEAVAHLLTEQKSPVLRRIHPPPESQSFEQLATIAASWGRKLPQRQITRKDLQGLVTAARNQPEGFAINLTLLRALQQARYSTEEAVHYALGSDNYCHFTSPIRRYPDLLIHRLVKGVLLSDDKGAAPQSRDELQAAALHCSKTERNAEGAEHELRQVLVLQHLATLADDDKTFTGIVTAVADYGLFVQSPRFLVEGLLRREELGDDWWVASPETACLTGTESGVTFRVGQRVKVTIKEIDVARRHLDLKLAEPVSGGINRRDRRRGRPPRGPRPAQPQHSPRRRRRG
jgi:ribonuclease R